MLTNITSIRFEAAISTSLRNTNSERATQAAGREFRTAEALGDASDWIASLQDPSSVSRKRSISPPRVTRKTR